MIPVPKTTQSLARGAEQERSRQAKAYDMDRRHNQGQMDSIRRHQYSKQAHAVNKQKTDMQNQQKTFSRKLHKTMEGKKFEDLMLEMKALPPAGQTGKKPNDDFEEADVREVKSMTNDERNAEDNRRAQEAHDAEMEERREKKEDRKEKRRKKAEEEDETRRWTGTGAGIKSALGGDVFGRGKRGRKARQDAAKKAVKGVLNAPGKIAGAAGRAVGAAGKAARNVASQRSGNRNVSFGQRPSGPTHTGSVTD